MKNIEDALRDYFIPSITGESSGSEDLWEPIDLLRRLGGMAVTTPHLNTEAEYNPASLLTGDIIDCIISQNT